MSASRDRCESAIAYLKAAVSSDEPAVRLSALDSFVVTNLHNGLLATYVVDQGDHFSFVQQRDLLDSGMTRAELHQRAIENLTDFFNARESPLHIVGGAFALVCGGNFEASMILVDALWDETLAHLAPNGFAAAIPNRDILAFCDVKSAVGLEKLRQVVRRLDGSDDHPITPTLYRRDSVARLWRPYAD
jgi:uncharacterized protein YtpQ (UPF0354 family)